MLYMQDNGKVLNIFSIFEVLSSIRFSKRPSSNSFELIISADHWLDMLVNSGLYIHINGLVHFVTSMLEIFQEWKFSGPESYWHKC